MTYRKTFTAALLVLPFALAACGSDDDSGESSTSSSARSTTTTAAPSTHKTDSDKPESSAGESPESSEPSAAGPQDDGQLAGRPGQPMPPVPVSGSASEDDKAAIANLVLSLGDGSKNAAEFNNRLIDNSCRAYIDSKGGEEAARQSANAVQDAGQFNDIARVPTFTSVDDITVNGDTATAVVHAESGGQSFSQNMNFTREDGAWKMCPTG